MTVVSAAEVREFVLDRVADELRALGLSPSAVPEDFDLLNAGVIDSLGILELIGAIESRFEFELDLEDLDAELLMVVGPFSDYVARQSAAR